MKRLDLLATPFVRRAPEKVAVDGPDGLLTYGALDLLANRIARVLRDAGVLPGDRVGVHLPRSGRAVAALLGALRAGAVYVPLDPGSPAPRVKLIARDCGLRHVLISPELLDRWQGEPSSDAVEHFFLTDGAVSPLARSAKVHPWAEIQSASPVSLDLGAAPDALAYILYTSGSTGVPKGVMLSHRNALAFVDWASELIGLAASDRVASVAPFHFDLSVFDVWGSLSRGATLVIVDEMAVASGRRMVDLLHEKEITVWYSVPSAFLLMLEAGGLDTRGARSLRAVFFAGEVFPVRHLRRTMAAIPQARFFNLFGPTETNVCLAYEVSSPPPLELSAIPIGRASCGDSIALLDPNGRPVAEGEIGELFVSGPTVMLGYWDGGRRTPPALPYPTGDLVSRGPDGNLWYHGRRDHMVKVHGFRVELGEVEAALLSHPGLKEALVFEWDQRLVAAVVPSDPSLSVLEVKRFCAARLPRYMVPSEVRILSGFPRTSSGKADRLRTRQLLLEGHAKSVSPV